MIKSEMQKEMNKKDRKIQKLEARDKENSKAFEELSKQNLGLCKKVNESTEVFMEEVIENNRLRSENHKSESKKKHLENSLRQANIKAKHDKNTIRSLKHVINAAVDRI